MRKSVAWLTLIAGLCLQLRLGFHVLDEKSLLCSASRAVKTLFYQQAGERLVPKITVPGKYFRRGPFSKSKYLSLTAPQTVIVFNDFGLSFYGLKSFDSALPLFPNLRSPPVSL